MEEDEDDYEDERTEEDKAHDKDVQAWITKHTQRTDICLTLKVRMGGEDLFVPMLGDISVILGTQLCDYIARAIERFLTRKSEMYRQRLAKIQRFAPESILRQTEEKAKEYEKMLEKILAFRNQPAEDPVPEDLWLSLGWAVRAEHGIEQDIGQKEKVDQGMHNLAELVHLDNLVRKETSEQ